MPMQIRSRIDCAVASFLIVVGAVGLYGSALIPYSGLEPVGAAPVPRWTSIAIIIMALAMLIMGLRRADAAPTEQRAYQLRPRQAMAAVGLLVLYILAMQLGLLGFRAATFLYIVAFGMLMSGLQWRALALHAAIALVVTLGSHTLFTDFLFIDLPQ